MATAEKKLKTIDFSQALRIAEGLYTPLQILSEKGELISPYLTPDLTDEDLVELMKYLVFGRTFDQRITALNRQGQLSNYPPFGGQEASQLASEFALAKDDYILPTYRDVPALIKHGLPMWKAFLWYKGHVLGNEYDDDLKALPPQVIIGSQCVQAAGIGLGLKKNGKPNVVMSYIGDGGTSQGDFYEGMNFAGVFATPTIFLVQNNFFAISVPRASQTKSPTLAQKALAAGIAGIQVDGMDPLAVYAATKAARDHAIAGNGPVLIETLTFRYGPHTMSDDPSRYRLQEEVDAWQQRDPLVRMRTFLQQKGLWSKEQEEACVDEVKAEIRDALVKANGVATQKISMLLRNMYEIAPPNVCEQIAQFEFKEN